MKKILLFSILFCAIAMPAIGALDDADLNKIRLIIKEEIKEEIKSIKADLVILKTDVARLDGRLMEGTNQHHHEHAEENGGNDDS